MKSGERGSRKDSEREVSASYPKEDEKKHIRKRNLPHSCRAEHETGEVKRNQRDRLQRKERSVGPYRARPFRAKPMQALAVASLAEVERERVATDEAKERVKLADAVL